MLKMIKRKWTTRDKVLKLWKELKQTPNFKRKMILMWTKMLIGDIYVELNRIKFRYGKESTWAMVSFKSDLSESHLSTSPQSRNIDRKFFVLQYRKRDEPDYFPAFRDGRSKSRKNASNEFFSYTPEYVLKRAITGDEKEGQDKLKRRNIFQTTFVTRFKILVSIRDLIFIKIQRWLVSRF